MTVSLGFIEDHLGIFREKWDCPTMSSGLGA
jgi:hypothetical protein